MYEQHKVCLCLCLCDKGMNKNTGLCLFLIRFNYNGRENRITEKQSPYSEILIYVTTQY